MAKAAIRYTFYSKGVLIRNLNAPYTSWKDACLELNNYLLENNIEYINYNAPLVDFVFNHYFSIEIPNENDLILLKLKFG